MRGIKQAKEELQARQKENTENKPEEINEEETELPKEQPEDVKSEETEPESIQVEENIQAEESIQAEENIQIEHIESEEEESKNVQAIDTESEEGKSEMQTPKKSILKKIKSAINKKTMLILGGVFAFLFVLYIGIALHFADRFLPGTKVNGIACSGKTVEETEKIIQEKVELYTLSLERKDNVTEEIKGSDIEIQYNGIGAIKEVIENQNEYAWPLALFQKKNVETNIDFDYNDKKLSQIIKRLECMQEENQVMPSSATPTYQDGTFVIVEEIYGTAIDEKIFNKVIRNSIQKLEKKINLEEKKCYILPTFTKDSKEVSAARDALNKCLEAKITYSLDSIVVKLDSSMFLEWLSVDEEMNVVVSEDKVKEFVNSLGTKYNTKPRSQQMTTPTGKVVTVSGATKGRTVGVSAESEQLISEIKDGTVITRKPVISQEATPAGQYAWGRTYVEVDLSIQHMWYIKNGSVIFETDVVTGKPGMDTPSGVFEILTKKRNKTLTGNIVPETGKPEYQTPVDYWARVTWSGIGFHDATWQSAFGGQRYKEGYGSHGCINMSLSAVAQFYNLISVGDPVVIHY